MFNNILIKMELQNVTSKNQQNSHLQLTIQKYRNRIRKQSHQRLFQSIRKTLIQTKNQHGTHNQEFLIQQHHFQGYLPTQIQQNIQVNPQIWQMLQYYCQQAQFSNQNIPYNQIIPIQHLNHIQQIKPMIEQIIPQYKLQKINENKYFEKQGYIVYKNQLGKGTFSTVWQGMNIITRQKIAAKEVRIVQQNEVRCLANLKSNFIVKIYKIIKFQHKNFIILQYCDNNLKQQLEKCQYNKQKVFHYFQQLVQGMDLLQSNNIIHRDLKFQNILVKNSTIKIADFGLAKFMEDQLEIQSKRCGTPYTMAPEIYFSKSKKVPYTIKSDIWSLGVILHLMLYRKHPFNSKGQDLKFNKRVILKKKYHILDKLIDKCLLFNPRQRISWQQFKHLYNLHKRHQLQPKQQEQQSLLYKSIIYQPHQENQLKYNQNKIFKSKYNLEANKKQQSKYQHRKMEQQRFQEHRKQISPQQQYQLKREVSKRKYQFPKNYQYQKAEIHQISKKISNLTLQQQSPLKKPIQLKIQLPKMNSIRIPNDPPNSQTRIYGQIVLIFLFMMLLVVGNHYMS